MELPVVSDDGPARRGSTSPLHDLRMPVLCDVAVVECGRSQAVGGAVASGQLAAAVNTSQQIVALLLIAVLYLGRTRTRCA